MSNAQQGSPILTNQTLMSSRPTTNNNNNMDNSRQRGVDELWFRKINDTVNFWYNNPTSSDICKQK